MNPEPQPPGPPETDEQQLCPGCLTPNATTADFCAKCGAPLSSYATTAPFERLFAEGHVYRQAAERPHRPVILIGVWALFGTVGAVGAVLLFFSPRDGVMAALAGAVMLALSAMMLGRTTWNFVAHRRQAGRETERE